MSIATASNTVSSANQLIPGIVLSVSPDGSTLVVTDPTRQTISLVSTSSNAVTTSYNGVGTSASWSPDDQAVYITTATLVPQATPAATAAAIAALTATPTIEPSSTLTASPIVLTHSTYTDWQTATATEGYSDTTVTVPSIGAFFAGASYTDARSYCPSSTVAATTSTSSNAFIAPNVENQFIPLVAETAQAITDQLAATTDGKHILGAHANGAASTLSDIDVTLPLPPVQPLHYGQLRLPDSPRAAARQRLLRHRGLRTAARRYQRRRHHRRLPLQQLRGCLRHLHPAHRRYHRRRLCCPSISHPLPVPEPFNS